MKTDTTKAPPFETNELRKNLAKFLDSPFLNPLSGQTIKVGNFKWGAYAFFDYDGEPIYIGQTKEMLRTRIRRHLTNQRTDAVAMSVLDPFEVKDIEVWPLPKYQLAGGKDVAANNELNALESLIYQKCVLESKFAAVLNEKDPPLFEGEPPSLPPSFRASIVSDEVFAIRSHPDFRIARRALIIGRLAQVISEREVQGGLRRVLLIQAKRLQWLAERRYVALGGNAIVERETGDEPDNGSE